MNRIYYTIIKDHFEKNQQMLFLAGPRQVGKTTLSRQIGRESTSFTDLNWDVQEDKRLILSGQSAVAKQAGLDKLQAQKPFILFDEIHKYLDWKNFLKGFYDKYGHLCHILVTGSAQLDTMRQSGDSLMGRYFLLHIHPFSVAECLFFDLSVSSSTALSIDSFFNLIQKPKHTNNELIEKLKQLSGFPDPFLKDNVRFYRQWSQTREQQLVREDIRDLSRIHELSRLHILILLLKNQAGQLINYSNLAGHIGISADTVKEWISLLEGFYYCFQIKPYTRNVTRTLRKNPKAYLWDWAQVVDICQRNENMIACHLLKAIHLWSDLGLGEFELFFLRDKDKREVDFLVTKDHEPWILVEVKSSGNTNLSPTLAYYQAQLNAPYAFQVAMDLPFVNQDCFQFHDPLIVPATTFLSQLV